MSWERFKKHYLPIPKLGFSLDISRMNFPDDFLDSRKESIERAFQAMAELEEGAIANPDENRMVGHYWLRSAERAPTGEITSAISGSIDRIEQFAADVHSGKAAGTQGKFRNILVIGIGGSALGPQFVSHALGHPERDRTRQFFFDNTDPDGIDLVLSKFRGHLGETLCIVISKSGSTPETRNGMLEAQNAYRSAGLEFSRHAVAVTGEGSRLDKLAAEEEWLARFPMWDWIGGRTSELAAVGLLPAALQGIPIREMLAGAAEMDEVTREQDPSKNPAALLSLMWLWATSGNGERDMVILPYKDRLMFFSKYLQQLIMESLGKEKDLDGKTVHQGIAVYGNKGSTDQHAYIQQLREGMNNFFVTFIEVLKDREGSSIEVEEGAITSGDYLQGFYLGTREALHANGRDSLTITISEVSPRTVGMLIALYERAVGFYASLVNINAYHQPGVEAGKKAASSILDLKRRVLALLRDEPAKGFSVETIADALNETKNQELIFKLLEHLASNPERQICRDKNDVVLAATYRCAG